ncbi:synapse differentiation-inducing gene protein 1-like isoform X2 [Clinocottus analis]
MDPSKSATAPPPEWAGEKSTMGHAPPPPYQDYQQPGYPQPGMGYPPPQQGYGPPPQYGGAYGQQQYPGGQQATVTVQPTVFVTRGPLAVPVNDYLCYSIFTLMCCCMPLGIAALIYSISAREANHSGDQVSAERSSRMARTLNHVALGLGIGLIILTIIYTVVM